jgi:hypothetical protein
MAKIVRQKDKDKEIEINTETGDVNQISPEAWNPKKRIDYEKCKLLVKQLTDGAINIITHQTVLTVAHALAVFGEEGRELFNQVCINQTDYNSDELQDFYKKALNTLKYKTPIKFINLCIQHGLTVLVGDDDFEYLLVEGNKPVYYTDKMEDEQIMCIQEHGFVELRNQYYFADIDRENKRVTLTPKSNFIMRVLYHINRGKNNKRVIGLRNNRNQSLILEIETKEINSLQTFRSLTEGMGYFVLAPSFKDTDLARIKMKMFGEEKTSTQLEVLGWDNKGFFAFCNGLYHIEAAQFHSVDEYGIVTLNNVHYHIPYHPGTDQYQFINEKKIFFRPSNVNFKAWAALYLRAFGLVGGTVLTFTVATIFSDHIFSKKNNFPMLFLYGEGGSGKGTVCEYAQHLFGFPQPPLKLTERANTDKARIRKFATYCNVPVRLEEFTNSIDQAGIKTLTNLYDRFGYERSSADTRYGTETVPIRSTVMITGNEYPADDPLIQRLILIDADRNVRNETEIKAFRELQKINQEGITTVLTEILAHRSMVVKSWLEKYESEYDAFRAECKDIDVPSRMFENVAVLLATYKCMEAAGLRWPHSYAGFKKYLKLLLRNQAEKRSTGAVVQKFWDIVLSLASKGLIHENKEFLIDGNSLFIRWKEIHVLYMEEHLRIYRQPGLLANTLQQKLKISSAWVAAVASKRFGKVNTSCFEFDYKKLNIDLIFIVNQKRSYREEELIQGDQEKSEKMADADRIFQQAQQNKVNTQDPPF